MVQIRPARQLTSPAQVTVVGSGFSAGEALQVVECAQRGTSTAPGDCALDGMQSAVTDAQGNVRVRLTVVRGPFGANGVVCDAHQACLVAVTQASLTPTEEADATISFR